MKDYLQKILICIVQNFIEFIKIGSVYIAINFAFRLSLIMIVFTSIYEQIHYATLAIFYGLFFDIIIIYKAVLEPINTPRIDWSTGITIKAI